MTDAPQDSVERHCRRPGSRRRDRPGSRRGAAGCGRHRRRGRSVPVQPGRAQLGRGHRRGVRRAADAAGRASRRRGRHRGRGIRRGPRGRRADRRRRSHGAAPRTGGARRPLPDAARAVAADRVGDRAAAGDRLPRLGGLHRTVGRLDGPERGAVRQVPGGRRAPGTGSRPTAVPLPPRVRTPARWCSATTDPSRRMRRRRWPSGTPRRWAPGWRRSPCTTVASRSTVKQVDPVAAGPGSPTASFWAPVILSGNAFPSVPITYWEAEGRPGAVLVEQSRGAQLLALGSRGRGGFRGLVMGSVSQQLLAHAPCPVGVLHSTAAQVS